MVEIIPKRPEKELPLGNIFLFAAGALLLAAIFGYVIIVRSEAKDLLAIQDLEADISRVGTKDDKETERKVFDSESKIADFKSLWTGRQKNSEFFNNFGSMIHPKIWFSSIDFDPIELKAIFSGTAADFKTLEQQLIFLQSENDIIENFELGAVTIGKEGDIEFDLTLDFTPKILD